jgi:hypothetical protein
MDKISGDGCVSPPGAAQSLMAQYLGDLPNRRKRPGTPSYFPRNINVRAQSDKNGVVESINRSLRADEADDLGHVL